MRRHFCHVYIYRALPLGHQAFLVSPSVKVPNLLRSLSPLLHVVSYCVFIEDRQGRHPRNISSDQLRQLTSVLKVCRELPTFWLSSMLSWL